MERKEGRGEDYRELHDNGERGSRSEYLTLENRVREKGGDKQTKDWTKKKNMTKTKNDMLF